MDRIDSFRNEYAFLSNFYEHPVTYDGITYKNSEAAFQASKTISAYQRSRGEIPFSDERLLFKDLSGGGAKRLGRKVRLRPDWEDVKVSVMRDIIHAKFSDESLKDLLLSTEGAYLIEGNTWGDRIWGQVNGEGENLLGQILMEERENIIAERSRGYER